MKWQHIRRGLWYLAILGTSTLLAAGCVIRDPQALTDIAQARNAIDSAERAGAADRFPDEFAELESRYLQTRGTFYACQEDKASSMALALIADANALGRKRVMVPAAVAPPPPPPNRPPRAVLVAPSEAEVNQTLQFRSTGTADPDGDPLTYRWSFGDGATSTLANPTHSYTHPGNYVVRLVVRDDRGGEDDVRDSVGVIRHVLLQETKGRVLFDFNKANLTPAARQALVIVVEDMQGNPQLRTEIVGHTDSRGPAAYNMRLSRRRAETVRDHLVDQGIPAAHLSLGWQGESQPVASNDTEAGRARNRRVELTIRPLEMQ